MRNITINTSILLVVIAFSCVPLFSQTVAEPPANFNQPNAGTEENPYQIANLANLRWLSETESVWGYNGNIYHFSQTADIDASETSLWNQGKGFKPIGYIIPSPFDHDTYNVFTSQYNGNNFIISNLYITNYDLDYYNYGYIGFFGVLYGAIIQNIRLENVTISYSELDYYMGSCVAPLAGFAGLAIVKNCSVSGNLSVTGENVSVNISGFIGDAMTTEILHCSSSVNMDISISNSDYWRSVMIGGLVGQFLEASILKNSYFNGSIISQSNGNWTAGLVGRTYTGFIEYCYVASVDSFVNAFGLVGGLTYTYVENCFWDTETTGVSEPFGTVTTCVTQNNYGLATFQLKQAQTYIDNDWDFVDFWAIDTDINTGYPYLLTPPIPPPPPPPPFVLTEAEPPSNVHDADAGSETNPYLIANLANLRWLSETPDVWGNTTMTPGGPIPIERYHFNQTADIDAFETIYWRDGKGFRMIGYSLVIAPVGGEGDKPFVGFYNGNNYKISNLYFNTEYNGVNHYSFYTYNGLFGAMLYSSIENVRLENITFKRYGDKYRQFGAIIAPVVGSMNWFSEVKNCSATGNIIYSPHFPRLYMNDSLYDGGASGLVGRTFWSVEISNSYSEVKLHSNGNDIIFGGLIGSPNSGAILRNSYYKGNILNGRPNRTSGGLIGHISDDTTIQYCYATSADSPFGNTYGLVGRFAGNVPIANSFWDSQATGISIAVGNFPDNTGYNSRGKTTAQMKQAQTYTSDGWDFSSIWAIDPDINDGYPYLRSIPPLLSDKDVTIAPRISKLQGNFPNPFNPETTIKFILSKDVPVKLDIYNIKGQKVRTLVNGVYGAGEHNVVWNGLVDDGRNVGSGVYFYRMQAGGVIETKKMVMVK